MPRRRFRLADGENNEGDINNVWLIIRARRFRSWPKNRDTAVLMNRLAVESLH